MKKKFRDIAASVVLCLLSSTANSQAADVLLSEIRIGTHADFSRIVFEFQTKAVYRLEPDPVAGRIAVTFQDAEAQGPAPSVNEAETCIRSLTPVRRQDDLVVDIAVAVSDFQLEHFALSDPFRLVLDIRCHGEAAAAAQTPPPEKQAVDPVKPQDTASPGSAADYAQQKTATKDSAPVSAVAIPPEEEAAAGLQNYLIGTLAILSLVILALAGTILRQHRSVQGKTPSESAATKLKDTEERLSSIDSKIREKLQDQNRK